MSWSISGVGTTREVERTIEAQQYMPDEIKEACKQIVSSLPNPEGKVLLFESSGHVDASYANGQIAFRYVDSLPNS